MRLSVDGFARLPLPQDAASPPPAIGAVALIALGAFSWKSNRPAAAAAEPVIRPARVATIDFRTAHAQPDAGRHGGAAHRDDAGLPGRRQGDLARGRCRRRRAAGPAHRPHRSGRLPARRRQCPRRARLRRGRLCARQGRSRSLPGAARQRRLHDPDARHAAVGLLDLATPRSSRRRASSRRPRTTSPTPSCMPTPPA